MPKDTTTTTPTKRIIYARCPRCANRRRVVVHSDGEARAARLSRCAGCGGGKPVGALPKGAEAVEVGYGVPRALNDAEGTPT